MSGGRPHRLRRLAAASAALAAVLLGMGALAGCGDSGGSEPEPPPIPPASPAPPGAPNVIVIMTDDQRYDSVGRMPHLSRLAEQGTTFSSSYVSYPLCCPSRATLFTGQYAHNHGVLDNRPPRGGYTTFENPPGTLPIALKAGGYRTAHVGKYLNGYGRRENNPEAVPAGWDQWYGFPDFAMYDYRINHNGTLRRIEGRSGYQTDVIARIARRIVRTAAAQRQPLFLSIATLAPHTESKQTGRARNPRPAPRHAGRFRRAGLPRPPSLNEADVSDKPSFVAETEPLTAEERRKLADRHRDRLRSLLAVDDLLGSLTRALHRAGTLRDTVILYTSDNGYQLGEHRRQKKGDFYEESVRVPLIVRGPGFPAGVRRDGLVVNVDLAATILDLAGAEPLRKPDGRSLLAVARDPGAGRHRTILLRNRDSVGVHTGRYMYAEHRGGEIELYDLRRDPYQLRNLDEAPAYAEVREELDAELSRLRDCAGAGCR